MNELDVSSTYAISAYSALGLIPPATHPALPGHIQESKESSNEPGSPGGRGVGYSKNKKENKFQTPNSPTRQLFGAPHTSRLVGTA